MFTYEHIMIDLYLVHCIAWIPLLVQNAYRF